MPENAGPSDWRPDQYLKFEKERVQPTIDLASRIDTENPRRIIDIGCGTGTSTAVLRLRWPHAAVTGLDSSAAMIAKAGTELPDVAFIRQDVSADMGHLGTFDIVFSNAALQWMPNHDDLITRLFSMVQPGGCLAVQVPNVLDEPFYKDMRTLIDSQKWTGAFDAVSAQPDYHPYGHFYDLLCTLPCELTMWQTSYIYPMRDHTGIVEWYKGSGLRPFLDALPDEGARRTFCEEYVEKLKESYSVYQDGSVLFVMPRIFFLAMKAQS